MAESLAALATVGMVALGTGILALTFFDIWVTVLHPGVESPLSNRFHRAGWRALRLAARRLPRQGALLHAGLPLLVAGLITIWLILLIVGFAALYYPWLGDPAAFATPPEFQYSWLTACYVSGATLFTLGYGDITPVAMPLRLLAIVEAGSGMATISLSVAYVLAVYPALSRQQACATTLDAEVAGQVNALPLLRRYLPGDGRWDAELAGRLRELALELLALTESHETHPILYYAHPPRVQQSALRLLLTVQHLIAALRYGLSPDRHGHLVNNPQLLLLEQAFGHSLNRLSASLHIASLDDNDTAQRRDEYAADFGALCESLERLGLVSARQEATRAVPVLAEMLPVPGARAEGARRSAVPVANADADGADGADPGLDTASLSPGDAYVSFRLATDHHITAYASTSGYNLAEAGGDENSPWRIAE